MHKIKQTRHGFHGTPVYKLWAEMVKRCETRSSSNYKHYGARGISVCKEWRENAGLFCEWALSNGYGKDMEIDRIDNDGGYDPNNCRFVTHKENCAANRRRVRRDSKTGVSGISMSKCGTFEVYQQVDGKQKYMGVFKTLKEAKKFKEAL